MQPSSAAAPSLLTLRRAIASKDLSAIRAALPDPSEFLPLVFRLSRSERDAILASVMPALEAEEDIWYIAEAAAMNDTARPGSDALVAVAPYLVADQLPEALKLARDIPDATASAVAQKVIRSRAVELSVPIDR